MRVIKFASAVALLAILTGCSASPSSPSEASEAPGTPTTNAAVSAEQTAALSDGKVSQDDYEAGYRRFADCMASAGFTLLDNGVTYDLHRFGIPSEAVDSGDDKRCYSLEFEAIDSAWQIAHEDTSETAGLIKACLIAAGVAPKSTMKEMNDQLTAADLDFAQCLQKPK